MQDVPFVDLFADWEKRDLEKMHCDGVHPSTEGYDLLSDQIYTRLNQTDFFS
jgi:lysophospholipase L1-like esterase